MKLPIGAEEITRVRAQGKRPADAVVVTLCGWRREFRNPQVLATRADHAWSFLAGLDVIVCVTRESKNVRSTLRAIATWAESPIALWDPEAQQGADIWPVWKGANVPEIHLAPLKARREAIFVRWAKSTWLPSENRRFACA